MTSSPLGSLAPFGGYRFERIENVIVLAAVASTNEVGRDLAGRMLAEQNDLLPTVIVGRKQLAGRGRAGRRWESPEGSLSVSLVLPWPEGPERIRLPLAIAIPLVARLAEAFGVRLKLKWPNDLVFEGRKLGGILIETRQGEDGDGGAIVGIGLNASTEAAELARLGLTSASSLLMAGAPAATLAADAALLALLVALDGAIGEGPTDIVAAFAAVSAHNPGEPIAVHDGGRRLEGSYAGVTADGFLRVTTATGEEVVLSGEVESF